MAQKIMIALIALIAHSDCSYKVIQSAILIYIYSNQNFLYIYIYILMFELS